MAAVAKKVREVVESLLSNNKSASGSINDDVELLPLNSGDDSTLPVPVVTVHVTPQQKTHPTEDLQFFDQLRIGDDSGRNDNEEEDEEEEEEENDDVEEDEEEEEEETAMKGTNGLSHLRYFAPINEGQQATFSDINIRQFEIPDLVSPTTLCKAHTFRSVVSLALTPGTPLQVDIEDKLSIVAAAQLNHSTAKWVRFVLRDIEITRVGKGGASDIAFRLSLPLCNVHGCFHSERSIRYYGDDLQKCPNLRDTCTVTNKHGLTLPVVQRLSLNQVYVQNRAAGLSVFLASYEDPFEKLAEERKAPSTAWVLDNNLVQCPVMSWPSLLMHCYPPTSSFETTSIYVTTKKQYAQAISLLQTISPMKGLGFSNYTPVLVRPPVAAAAAAAASTSSKASVLVTSTPLPHHPLQLTVVAIKDEQETEQQRDVAVGFEITVRAYFVVEP